MLAQTAGDRIGESYHSDLYIVKTLEIPAERSAIAYGFYFFEMVVSQDRSSVEPVGIVVYQSALFAEHPSDMIGFYIQALKKPDMSPVEKKALFYGIHALLLTTDERS